MVIRTLTVEFAPEAIDSSIPEDTQVHDITLDDAVDGAPEVLENPHVDFPGVWRLAGRAPSGAYRYEKVARVADTSDTVTG